MALLALSQDRSANSDAATVGGGNGQRISEQSCAECHGEEAAGHGHAESIPSPAHLTLVGIAPPLFEPVTP